ncbi:uncharacterized protein PV09_06157 [Verruconis gallopava]|uniref:Protein HRI1 n=1 Tax=Verruconis gallopava TaxID=253628 RepID=A0A0D2A7I9_9PEZI|nr:uncharacterized protein PV09_06157 [Verruconis gallopava]KIW02723.1 hypothetical protein PV09_06157 [Verruconis gallopava]
MSRASTRVSIRWLPDPASEETDTLVLSVDGYYVDLRVRKSDGAIDWLLAGERIVDPENTSKVKFTHIIDSNHDPRDPHPAPDVGEFSKLPNGDDLETGQMPNPAAGGKMMAYEEVWRELNWKVSPENTDMNWILEALDNHDDNDDLRCKTFYAKVGRYYLAAQKKERNHDAQFAAIRQDFQPETREWKVIYQIGDTSRLARYSAEDEEITNAWSLADQVQYGGESCVVRALSAQ